MHIAHRPTRRNCRTILWRWRCELRITMSRYRWSFRSAESNSSIHVTTAKSARTEEARIRLRSFRHRFRLQMLASRRWKASTVSIHYACINAIKLRSNQLAGMGFALTVTRQRFLLSISVTRERRERQFYPPGYIIRIDETTLTASAICYRTGGHCTGSMKPEI